MKSICICNYIERKLKQIGRCRMDSQNYERTWFYKASDGTPVHIIEVFESGYHFKIGCCDRYTHNTPRRYSDQEVRYIAAQIVRARVWLNQQRPEAFDEIIGEERRAYRRMLEREGQRALNDIRHLFSDKWQKKYDMRRKFEGLRQALRKFADHRRGASVKRERVTEDMEVEASTAKKPALE